MALDRSSPDGVRGRLAPTPRFPIYREDVLRERGEIPHKWGSAGPYRYTSPSGSHCVACGWLAGLTQEQLALESGVQRNFISLIETGQNQPTITTIGKLARALELSASGLVAEAERSALPL